MTTKCTCTKDGFNDAGVDTYGCPLHSTPTVEEIVDKPCPFCGHKPKWQLTKVKYCQLHGDPIQDIIFGCFSSNCEVRPRIEKPSVEICRAIWNKSLCNQFRFEEGAKAEMERCKNLVVAHLRTNTYDGNDARVFKTTIEEVVGLLSDKQPPTPCKECKQPIEPRKHPCGKVTKNDIYCSNECRLIARKRYSTWSWKRIVE